MSQAETTTMDGNEAVARVAYALNEVIAIYPITPSSPMGEWADQWASERRTNLWGTVPLVVEMQSEGGAAGAVHGALQAGSLTTTFTASQGLLLMIPNMYRIAGELTPCVIHVAARSLAVQGLSIFGDQGDVMAARATGWAMLASNSVQEAADLALIAQAAALESRLPFLHFFDGFRTSHEVARIVPPTPDQMRALIDDDLVRAHRARALTPDRPVLRGAAHNPDVCFQARETANPFYRACPEIVQNAMDRFAQVSGRSYRLFDYFGAPDAERVIVLMGSGAEAVHETVEHLLARGEKVGVLKVRLFRPFSVAHFLDAVPKTANTLAVLDRTKEAGGVGEPLYLDVVAAYHESNGGVRPRVVGGRYGLSSKEFTPAMVLAVFDELKAGRPRNHFTVGIRDDVTHTSLDFDPAFSTEDPQTVRAVFYGLGSDGTVGANKNSIKIIGEETDNYAQGYFVYDSKQAGSVTVSHLRFGPKPIRSTYLASRATFVACHQFSFLDRIDVLAVAEPGATFLLNSPCGPEEVWDKLPRSVQEAIVAKGLHFFVIDAYKVAQSLGMGARINTIMQPCFFALSKVLPQEEAVAAMKKAIVKTYGKRGEAVVQRNRAAIDQALSQLHEVKVPGAASSGFDRRPAVPAEAPEFVRRVTSLMLVGDGDALPVSALPCDGTFPTGTTKWEKRNIATHVPVWDADVCIQCGKCVLVCPHAVIRGKVYEPAALEGAPEMFKSTAARWPEMPDGYLEHVRRAKAALGIPLIASLNGSTPGGWTEYARLIEQAGADALELNVYALPTDPWRTAADVERQYEDLVRAVKSCLHIPIAVKLSPFFTAPAEFAHRLTVAGADALVLFNRFYQPDFDLEALEVVPSLRLSDPSELLLRLHWTAILYGAVEADLAVTGGIHSGTDALKAMMAGARVAMLTSALLKHGIDHLKTVRADMVRWMEEHGYAAVRQMQGSMSLRHVPDPGAYQRANYMKVLRSYALRGAAP